MKSTQIFVLLGSAAVAACLALPSAAQPHAKPEQIIEHLDRDGDKLLTIEEFEMPRRGRDRGPLAVADTDGDGNVSRDEFQAHVDERAAQMAERFDLADLNDDGFLTEDEIRLSMFRRVDSNADGYIDADELAAMRNARRAERAS